MSMESAALLRVLKYTDVRFLFPHCFLDDLACSLDWQELHIAAFDFSLLGDD